MREEKGITLAVLAVTIIIMIILSGAIITYGSNSLNTTKLKNFSYEMQQIQGKVDALYEKIKLGNDDILLLGRDITQSARAMETLKKVKNIDYLSITDISASEHYTDERSYNI
ncbi:MAG: hypothetical protein HFJ54_02315 [Clostridia bacterium]|nr:hypothetical protein [Clostridia bacterium]